MTVRLFSAKPERASLIAGFLVANHVNHELIESEDVSRSGWYRCDELPAIEVDGELFVDPNEEALRQIFDLQ